MPSKEVVKVSNNIKENLSPITAMMIQKPPEETIKTCRSKGDSLGASIEKTERHFTPKQKFSARSDRRNVTPK